MLNMRDSLTLDFFLLAEQVVLVTESQSFVLVCHVRPATEHDRHVCEKTKGKYLLNDNFMQSKNSKTYEKTDGACIEIWN